MTARQDGSQPPGSAGPATKFSAGTWTDMISAAAVLVSVGLQFVDHFGLLLGRSTTAISGATILAVSVVFAALIIVASWHQVRRARHYEDALDEAAEVSALLVKGRLVGAGIQRYRERLPKETT